MTILKDALLQGTRAGQPAAATVGEGTLYFVTDEEVTEQQLGGAWTAYSPTASGAGTVTSVGQSFTGGLISVAGSPVTTTGTLALTVAGTSGGIPYFSSGSTWASSGALTANGVVLGGGAGATPTVVASPSDSTKFLNGSATPAYSVPNGTAQGTSMPGGPSTNDRIFRTDLGLVFYYDGTRWLSLQQYTIAFAIRDAFMPRAATTSSAVVAQPLFVPTNDFWIENFQWSAYVSTPSSGTQYWDIDFRKVIAAAGSSIATDTTNGDTTNEWQKHTKTVGALLGTTTDSIDVTLTRVSTAGAIYFTAAMVGRIVGT